MNANEHAAWLRYPAYGLYHLDSLQQSASGGYLYDIVPTFETQFDAAAQQSILTALKWALDSDTLPWEEILPGLPQSDDFKRQHFRITHERLLKKQFTIP